MSILLDAFNLPPAKAVEYLRKKGLRISGAWYTVWKQQHQQSFTVANVAKLDLLQNIRDLVRDAVEGRLTTDANGDTYKRAIPFQQFKKDFKRNIANRGWLIIDDEVVAPSTGEIISTRLGSTARLKTIYQTNVQTALNAGRYQSQREVVADLPNWQYVAIMDGVTTDRCRDLNGKVYRADDPVWDRIYPPNHFRCRSRVRTLTDTMVERDGLEVESSSGNLVSKKEIVGKGENAREVTVNGIRFTNAVGEAQSFFPDPGFDYNPGKTAFTPDLKKYDTDIAALYNGDGN